MTMTRTRLAAIAAVTMLVGVGLAWVRAVPAMAGFVLFVLGGVTALLVTIASAVQALRGKGFGAGGLVAAVATGALLVAAAPGGGKPRTNDFTTDLADPPAFSHAATLPANGGRDLSYPPAFADQQRACCPDLRPAQVAGAPADALARARRVAERMPDWTVTASEPATGTIEAVVTSRVFGFQDDVVIRVRGNPDGSSRVDVRSKSRNGQGDLGVNAARIRAYVTALEAER